MALCVAGQGRYRATRCWGSRRGQTQETRRWCLVRDVREGVGSYRQLREGAGPSNWQIGSFHWSHLPLRLKRPQLPRAASCALISPFLTLQVQVGVFLGLRGRGVKGVKVRLELAPRQCGALEGRGRRALHQSTLAINNASATEGGPQEA